MEKHDAESIQTRWALLRFSIIGPLLSAPPDKGELQQRLQQLSRQSWKHPITSCPVSYGASTIERWYYKAKDAADPVAALRPRQRKDAGRSRELSDAAKQALQAQYQAHKSWSYQLHADNLKALCQQRPELGEAPSYSTIRRYMKAQGLTKRPRVRRKETAGTLAAEQRLASLEVRSYEVDHVHGLWHLDFHHGSLQILTPDGQWHKPLLLAVMDDRSRVVCHAQWYLDETTESLVHGFVQAIQKRALPRALMSDNGSAMTSDEFTQGLSRLGILHQTTLPYSPYQNGKQEFFWTNIEGRLLPMLEGEPELTLELLNRATQAWLEREYHHRIHSELKCTPTERYLEGPCVGRPGPDSQTLRQAFRQQVKRKQRRSDGTLSLNGQRFEIPARYRHLEQVFVQYARWDLTRVDLVNALDGTVLCRLYPLNKAANASGKRRTLEPSDNNSGAQPTPQGIAPLLKQLMADYAATGLPPAYIPTNDMKPAHHQEENQ